MILFDIKYNSIIGASNDMYYIKCLSTELGNTLFNYVFNYHDDARDRKRISIKVDLSNIDSNIANNIVTCIEKIFKNSNNISIPRILFHALQKVWRQHKNINISIEHIAKEDSSADCKINVSNDVVNKVKEIHIELPNNFHLFVEIGILPNMELRGDKAMDNIVIHSALSTLASVLVNSKGPLHLLDLPLSIENICTSQCKHLIGNIFCKQDPDVINSKRLLLLLGDSKADTTFLSDCYDHHCKTLEALTCKSDFEQLISNNKKC